MKIDLLQSIRARILSDPDAFRMDTWSCGTAHCIAGWACVLAGQPIVNPEAQSSLQQISDGRRPDLFAVEFLDLPHDGMNLFHVQVWPYDFQERYNNAATRAERAQIAAERIDAYIAAEGHDGGDEGYRDDDDGDDWDDGADEDDEADDHL